jgi:cytoskeletal protein CcmA (bactofilin family)
MATTGTLVIRGELTAEEDLRIDGTFQGAITLRGHHLIVGEGSSVDAALSARVVTLLGTVKGQIVADIVDIARTAHVQANVLAKQLALEDGALFNGSVNTERAAAAIEVARHRSGQRQHTPNTKASVR